MGLRSGYAVVVAAGCFALAAACSEPANSGDERDTGGSPGVAGGTAAPGRGGDSGTKDPPGGVAFADGQLLELRFTLSEADLTSLEEHGNLEQFVRASVIVSGSGFDAQTFESVGLRHKGNWTLHHCWDENGGVRDYTDECRKLSYKVKFDFESDSIRFDGLKRINLHAASADATKARELLAYSTFRDFGVDAPRTTPARVYVNGALRGLFIAVEEVDGRYTKAHFPDAPDGNLYKEVWPRTETPDADFVSALETNEKAADVSGMRAFAEAIAGSDAGNFLERMKPWVEVEQVLRYIAVDRALKNWDGIMAFYEPDSPHNFFWYHADGADGRFHLVPWDLDNTFWEFDPYTQPEQWVTAPPIPDWNATPLDCNPRSIWEPASTIKVTPPRCDPFLDLLARTSWSRFVELGNELLAGPLAGETVSEKLAARIAQLDPIVRQDPTLDYAAWRASLDAFRPILERGRRDFRSFLDSGLVEERGPGTIEPPADVDGQSSDRGLHLGGVTNFEFAGAPASGVPDNVYAYSDPLGSFSLSWNTEAPISGKADLRIDFSFQDLPGQYDEYVGLGIATPGGEEDIREFSSVTLTLASDVARPVRVRLSSPAYVDTWGDIWSEFSVEVAVGPTPKTVRLPLASFVYPEWARAAWTAGQGFTTTDAEARKLVLERFDGLEFTPSPLWDSNGNLTPSPQAGNLRVDNIYFE